MARARQEKVPQPALRTAVVVAVMVYALALVAEKTRAPAQTTAVQRVGMAAATKGKTPSFVPPIASMTSAATRSASPVTAERKGVHKTVARPAATGPVNRQKHGTHAPLIAAFAATISAAQN